MSGISSTFYVMSYMDEDFNNSRKWKERFVVELQNRELNVVLRKTAMILRGKVCSVNFEPPDIDLCSACHVYTISRRACIISILFIVNRFTWNSN